MTTPSPQDIAARFAQGVAARADWDLDRSERIFRELCVFEFARPRALTELAITLAAQGRSGEALVAIEQAGALAPDDATILQNALVLEKLREPENPAQFVRMHREWGHRFAPPGGSLYRALHRDPNPDRRLRIAYLAVDAHRALHRFVRVLALQHDARQFEVCFFYRSTEEALVADMRAALPQVRHVCATGLPARELALQLAQMRIDVAVDLCGHGVGQVLQALAYRPAPLQLTWLDYVGTTGVSAMDGRIADAVTDPDDADWPEVATEPVQRLPVPQWCADLSIPEADPGFEVNGEEAPIVFGLLNAANKTSPELLRRAAILLQRVANSRLRVLGISGQAARKQLLAAFPNTLHARIEMLDRVPEPAFRELLAGITVALDPLVFSGATSSLDCLAAGIPVVTQPGILPHTRSTASILQALGLSCWVASDASDYIDIVMALANDRLGLADWRQRLPARLRASTLSDGQQFMPILESALRTAWQDCCARGAAGADIASDDHQRNLITRTNSMLQQGDAQACVYALETLNLSLPSETVRRNLSRAWNNLGRERRLRQAEADARDAFAQALKIWPENPEARSNVGLS